MTNQDYTDITYILDRSGSMSGLESDVMGGRNAFVADQKDLPGKCVYSEILFDDKIEFTVDAEDISEVKDLTSKVYFVRGMTSLLDAIGNAITKAGSRFSAMSEEDRPGKVLIVIFTDGLENVSREFDNTKINRMIETQKTEFSWEFVFMAANQDAIATAKSYGIQGGNAMNFVATSKGVTVATDSLTRSAALYRTSANYEAGTFVTDE